MKWNKILISVIIVISGFYFPSCSKIFTNSPSKTIVKFYTLANQGKYSEAEKLLSNEALNTINGPFVALAGGFKGVADNLTKNGNIKSIKILKETIRGEGANVKYIIYFKDGTQKQDEDNLIKENGMWKITN